MKGTYDDHPNLEHPGPQVVVEKLGGMCDHIVAVDYENTPYHKQMDEDPDFHLKKFGKGN